MPQNQRALESKQPHEANTRNLLIAKIALFLNYLSKTDHEKLLGEMAKFENPSQIDVLKIMRAKNYVTQQEILLLKKTCLGFARAQTDNRFGALCIEFGFLTQSNLDLALEEQAKLLQSGKPIMLGDLLVDAGMLSKRQKNLVLQKQKLETGGKKSCPEEPDTMQMREIREKQIILLVQHDGLKAFLLKTDQFSNEMPLEDLKFFLEKHGIIYGVKEDDQLTHFLQMMQYHKTPFEVACGLAAVDGTDARITYLFEQDYLKAGSFSADGSIDFKDRGKIPFVKQGDIIAEKILPQEGKNGVNIYGDVVSGAEPRDLDFILGKNVSLSSDRLRVVSDVEGNPKVMADGEISVNDAYFIDGDVDYTTGHVKFDKNVFISGSIKSGFRVEAIDVVAKTIDGGIVCAQGNVFVQNGITESSIQAKGNITAGFLHRSKAACMGNMKVAKEIADTAIAIEGTLEITRGRMVSSSVTAKGGVKIYHVGSERAKPSAITVGISIYFEKEIQKLDADIERHQNLLEQKTMDKTRMESELKTIDQNLSEYHKSRDRTRAMMDQMQQIPGKNADDRRELFQKSLAETEQTIQELTARKVFLDAQVKKNQIAIDRSAAVVKTSMTEKFSLKRLNRKNPPKPIVDIGGKALAGTRMYGRHARLILHHDISRSRIMEMAVGSQEGAKKHWEMIVSPM